MALFVWIEMQYGIGIDEIDEQHKELMSIANNLYESLTELKGETECKSLLDSLVDYVGYHFDAEESIMEQASYPGLEAHRKEHADLTEQVLKFCRDFKEGKRKLPIEMMNFLNDWLVHHIIGSDKDFGNYYAGISKKS